VGLFPAAYTSEVGKAVGRFENVWMPIWTSGHCLISASGLRNLPQKKLRCLDKSAAPAHCLDGENGNNVQIHARVLTTEEINPTTHRLDNGLAR
jgi:hypothetical protein